MTITESFRAGYVALIGLPNAGKSTLLNALLEFKLTIVTDKPQTTRKKVLGILQEKQYQIVFIDTPGVVDPGYDLQKKLMEYLQASLEDADIVCHLYDAEYQDSRQSEILSKLIPDQKIVIPVVNKIDLAEQKNVKDYINKLQDYYSSQKVIAISALRKVGLEELVGEIVKYLPEHPPYFPSDQLSDETERFFVAEIIREKIYELYSKEIPYSCHVVIENFIEKSGRKDLIQAIIYVDQSSQKGIIIGKGGKALKQVGLLARRDIETFLGRPVFLELYVKVLQNWRKKMSKLKSLGY
jgi:GTP-binding protein Era